MKKWKGDQFGINKSQSFIIFIIELVVIVWLLGRGYWEVTIILGIHAVRTNYNDLMIQYLMHRANHKGQEEVLIDRRLREDIKDLKNVVKETNKTQQHFQEQNKHK